MDKQLAKVLTDKKIITSKDTAFVFYNIPSITNRFSILKETFPANTLHTVAMKANPLSDILKKAKEHGLGTEVASLPELYMAEKIGFAKDKIVFDSPAKTLEELKYAFKSGVRINADNLYELERIDKLFKRGKSKSIIGLRVNPQVGEGKIKITSVGGKYSKFGVPLNSFRHEVIAAYLKYEWLTGIHLHVGSQGCSIELLLKGIWAVYQLAQDINGALILSGSDRQINSFDIGGGYPVSFNKHIDPPSMLKYAVEIQKRFPKFLNTNVTLITEFGRWIFANSAITATRVEYVKEEAKIKTAMVHVGADMFIRRAYFPDVWHHDFSVYDKEGNKKEKLDTKKYIIAGPLCFAGDLLAKGIQLPVIEEGDWIIIHDTGAYTLSMWSRYNSRQIPKVVAYNGKKNQILKKRESLESVYNFWNQ